MAWIDDAIWQGIFQAKEAVEKLRTQAQKDAALNPIKTIVSGTKAPSVSSVIPSGAELATPSSFAPVPSGAPQPTAVRANVPPPPPPAPAPTYSLSLGGVDRTLAAALPQQTAAATVQKYTADKFKAPDVYAQAGDIQSQYRDPSTYQKTGDTFDVPSAARTAVNRGTDFALDAVATQTGPGGAAAATLTRPLVTNEEGEVDVSLGTVASRSFSGEDYLATLARTTAGKDAQQAVRGTFDDLERRGPVGHIAATILDELFAPANIASAAFGGAAARSVGGGVLGSILDPVGGATASGARAFAGEAAVGVAARLAGETVQEVLPDDTPTWLRAVAGLGAGLVAGGVTAGRFSPKTVGLTPTQVADTVTDSKAVQVLRGDPLRKAEYTPIKQALPGQDAILGIRQVDEGVGTFDDILTKLHLKRTDPQATPILSERERILSSAGRQAEGLEQQTRGMYGDFTWEGAPGASRIVLPDGQKVWIEDMVDLKTRPAFWSQLTPQQRMHIETWDKTFAKYNQLLDALGDTKAVTDTFGGYLPRVAKFEEEGLKSPKLRGIGTPGAQKARVYATKAQGVAAGQEYLPLHEAVKLRTEELGRKAVDLWTRSELEKIGDTPKALVEQVYPEIYDSYKASAADIISLRGKIQRLETSSKATRAAGDEVDRIIEKLAKSTPEGQNPFRDLAKLGTRLRRGAATAEDLVTERLGRPVGSEPVRIKLPVSEADTRASEVLDKFVKSLDEVVPDDVEVLRTMDTALKRTAERLETLAERGVVKGKQLEDLRTELADAQKYLDETMRPRYEKALRDVRKGRMGTDVAPGVLIDKKVADIVNRAVSRQRNQGAADKLILTANAVLFPFQLGIDLGYAGVHGLIPAGIAPRQWGAALVTSVKALKDPSVAGRVFNNVDLELKAMGLDDGLLQLRKNGLAVTGSGFTTVGRETLGSAVRDLPGIKQLDRAMGAFGDVWRANHAKGRLRDLAAAGYDISDDALQSDLMHVINNASGYAERRFLGDIGEAFLTAPRLYEADFELLAKVVAGGGVGGAYARNAAIRLVGEATLLTFAINEARGQETDLDITSPNFLAIRDVAGQDIKLLGRYDSLAKLIIAAGQGDADYVARSKLSPGTSFWVELLTERDFRGQPSGLKDPANFAKSLLPMWAEGFMKEGDLKAVPFDIFGLKSTPLSLSERRDKLAEDTFGSSYKDLSEKNRRVFREGHPELFPDGDTEIDKALQGLNIQQAQLEGGVLSGETTLPSYADARKDIATEVGALLELKFGDSERESKDPLWESYTAIFKELDPIKYVRPDEYQEVLAERLSEWEEAHPEARDYLLEVGVIGKGPVEKRRREDMAALGEYFAMPRFVNLPTNLTDDEILTWRTKVTNARRDDPGLKALPFDKAAQLVLFDSGLPMEDILSIGVAERAAYQNPERELFKLEHPERFFWFQEGRTWADLPQPTAADTGAAIREAARLR